MRLSYIHIYTTVSLHNYTDIYPIQGCPTCGPLDKLVRLFLLLSSFISFSKDKKFFRKERFFDGGKFSRGSEKFWGGIGFQKAQREKKNVVQKKDIKEIRGE